MNLPNPNLNSLFASRPSSADIDLNLAAHYAPILRFDAREPFLPLAVAYRIFWNNTIRSYLNLGYIPSLYLDGMIDRWKELCEKVAWPFTPGEWVPDNQAAA